jgi:methyl-accepting chemotaxis protein
MFRFGLGSIKARLTLLMFLSVAGLLLTAGFGLLQLSRFNQSVEANLAALQHKTAVILEVQAANVDFKIQVQEWKDILLRGNDPAAFDKYRKQFLEKADSVQEHLGKVRQALQAAGSPQAAGVDELITSHKAMLDTYLTALQSFDAANPLAGKVVDKLVKGVDRAATASMSKLAADLQQDVNSEFARVAAENRGSLATSQYILVASSVLVVALLLGITLATTRHIRQNVALLQHSLAQARQQLDLTVRVPVTGRDELAQAGAAINALFEELQAILQGMRQHARDVAGAAGQLTGSIGRLSRDVGQQNESTSAMAAAAEELAVSIAHVSDSANTANGISRQSLAQCEQGSGIIGHAVTTMAAAAQEIQSTSDGIEALGQRVQDIGQIANVIRDIADQTNLLALNAAIEAARAGEQGRGFAVVADEVRKLAERTGKATTEIAEVISAIQGDAEVAVKDMHGVVSRFGDIAGTTSQAGDAITQIRAGSEEVMTVTQDISSALREQSAASDSIARQVEVIASMSESSSSAMQGVSGAAGTMDQLAQRMQTQLGRFVV